MSNPLVSCICPTHGRPPGHQWLLEEAIESFIRQNYEPRELVILNDCPRQTLACDAPGVRIENHPYRCTTLGEKYNVLVELALGDIVLPWEDDDISLPGRIGQAVEALLGPNHGEAPALFDYFRPLRSWFWDGAGPHCDHVQGCTHNASAYTKEAWRRAGKYPHDRATNGAQDQIMDRALVSCARTAPGLPNDPRCWQYIYRWGVSDNHLSGNTDPDQAWQEAATRAVPGEFVLRPHWRLDYPVELAKYLETRG